jgi:hypothetical protein
MCTRDPGRAVHKIGRVPAICREPFRKGVRDIRGHFCVDLGAGEKFKRILGGRIEGVKKGESNELPCSIVTGMPPDAFKVANLFGSAAMRPPGIWPDMGKGLAAIFHRQES